MKSYFPNHLVLSCFLICSFFFFTSCSKDADLLQLITEQQVNESKEVLDQEEEEEESEEGGSEEENGSQNEESENENEESPEEENGSEIGTGDKKVNIIFDTDANNELDDQHALAYLLSNGDLFSLEAITVNATQSGGDIDGHYEEAQRILKLYNLESHIEIFKGANGSFDNIGQNWNPNNFDGKAAADILIERTLEKETLIVAVGKLTNVALAIKKDPALVNRTKVIWLGSNYPSKGEYNLENDLSSVNFVIESGIPLEIVTVRLGTSLPGSSEVFVNVNEIKTKMPGLGPKAAVPVTGRHGGQYNHFGDYSISLFEKIGKDTRSLFDLVALSILKNPNWGVKESIPAPILQNGNWVERPGNNRKITIWGDFKKDPILEDFFESIKNYTLVE